MLTIVEREWFNELKSGKKKVEYVEMKEHWGNAFVSEDLAESYYRNGKIIYKPTGAKALIEVRSSRGVSAPHFTALVSLSIGAGKPEWGAAEGQQYYRLFIHEVKEEG